MHPIKSVGKLIDDNAGRHRRQKPAEGQGDQQPGKEEEKDFEYYADENVDNQEAADAAPAGGPAVQFTTGPIRRLPRRPVCPFATVSTQHDQVQEWISEYTAQQAHDQRLHDDNDPERMAEAAAQLLSQMDLQEDEKLRESRFVAYLKQLSNGHCPQPTMPCSPRAASQSTAFADWRQQYAESISPLVSDEDRASWDAVVKDWQTYEARGHGYEGFAQREFTYQFYYANPQDNPFTESHALQQTAHQLMAEGRTRQAIIAFEALVQQSPSALHWFHLARLQVENEQDILAIAAFQRALQSDPSLTSGWIEMAGCLVNERCRSEAVDALLSYLRNTAGHHASVPDPNADPASLAEECLRRYEGIARESGDDPNILTALSILYCLSGDSERGIESIARALQSENDVHTQLVLENRMGALHANSGDYASALRLYDQILARRPEMARAHYNRGVSLLNGADYAAAIRSFALAIGNQLIPTGAGAMRPDIARGLDHVWDMLGMACEMADQPDLAIAAKAHDLDRFQQ